MTQPLTRHDRNPDVVLPTRWACYRRGTGRCRVRRGRFPRFGCYVWSVLVVPPILFFPPDGKPTEFHKVVFYGMMGMHDLSNVKTGSAEGMGVWKVQTAEDFRGSDVCGGTFTFILESILELQRSTEFMKHVR